MLLSIATDNNRNRNQGTFLGNPDKKPYKYTVHETRKFTVICRTTRVQDYEISAGNY